MRLSDALSGVRRVAFDTSALIDFVEEDPRSIAVMRQVFQRIAAGDLAPCGSVLLLTKALVAGPANSDAGHTAEDYRAALAPFELAPVTHEIADLAAELRQSFGLKSMDALHAASAAQDGCDALLTADGDFKRLGRRVHAHGGRGVAHFNVRELTR